MLETDEHAPTAIRAPEQAARAHVADSLVALEIEAVGAAQRITDLGSGAGFPGLALAVALPAAEVSLVESQRRRCEFLRRACAAAEVENARVVWARAEGWREGVSRSDVVVARALAPQPVVLEYAAPLLRMGGTLVDWRGRRDPVAEEAAERVAALLGLHRAQVREGDPVRGGDRPPPARVREGRRDAAAVSEESWDRAQATAWGLKRAAARLHCAHFAG